MLVGHYKKLIEFFEASVVVVLVELKGSNLCLGCALRIKLSRTQEEVYVYFSLDFSKSK